MNNDKQFSRELKAIAVLSVLGLLAPGCSIDDKCIGSTRCTTSPITPSGDASPSSDGTQSDATNPNKADAGVRPDAEPIVPDKDDDEDGILNQNDNCPRTKNPEQQDRDNDKVGDHCDNCFFTPNPGQEESDKPGIGAACASLIQSVSTSGKPFKHSFALNEWLLFELPSGQEENTFFLSDSWGGSSGDVDIYLRHGALGHNLGYDYQSAGESNVEHLLKPAPSEGVSYLGVHGFSTSPDVELLVTRVQNVNIGDELLLREVEIGAYRHFAFRATETGTVTVATNAANGDADLFLQRKYGATKERSEAKGTGPNSAETVSLSATKDDTVYFSILAESGKALSDVTIRITSAPQTP